jgi:HK97 family phage portal protein
MLKWIVQKLNPAQSYIRDSNGANQESTVSPYFSNVRAAVKSVGTVQRGCSLIIDSFSMINYDIKEKYPFSSRSETGVKQATLHRLLNQRPNLDEDISSFRRKLVEDFIYEGNFFIYFDGSSIYHLPAKDMIIITGSKSMVSHYQFGMGSQAVTFKTSEVVHVKDNSVDNIARGDSRLISALHDLNSRRQMTDYQANFFTNGMAPGIILTTDSVMSNRMKDRLISYWIEKFNPRTGANRPLILDNGMKPENISVSDFSKLQYTETIKGIEEKALHALGVPPILLDSGNNANIRPNVELFYNMTVIPIAKKLVAALEAFFAWDIQESTHGIAALAPDLKVEAERITSLVNNGILLGNEGRKKLREEPIDDPLMDKIRIPANVAGSATGVAGQEGGKPANDDKE